MNNDKNVNLTIREREYICFMMQRELQRKQAESQKSGAKLENDPDMALIKSIQQKTRF